MRTCVCHAFPRALTAFDAAASGRRHLPRGAARAARSRGGGWGVWCGVGVNWAEQRVGALFGCRSSAWASRVRVRGRVWWCGCRGGCRSAARHCVRSAADRVPKLRGTPGIGHMARETIESDEPLVLVNGRKCSMRRVSEDRRPPDGLRNLSVWPWETSAGQSVEQPPARSQ